MKPTQREEAERSIRPWKGRTLVRPTSSRLDGRAGCLSATRPYGVNPVGVRRSRGLCYPQVHTCGYSRLAPAGACHGPSFPPFRRRVSDITDGRFRLSMLRMTVGRRFFCDLRRGTFATQPHRGQKMRAADPQARRARAMTCSLSTITPAACPTAWRALRRPCSTMPRRARPPRACRCPRRRTRRGSQPKLDFPYTSIRAVSSSWGVSGAK
jgi:hypothetical protein